MAFQFNDMEPLDQSTPVTLAEGDKPRSEDEIDHETYLKFQMNAWNLRNSEYIHELSEITRWVLSEITS